MISIGLSILGLESRDSQLRRRSRSQSGLVLLAAMAFIVIVALATGSMVGIYKTNTQREKELELLFIGEQYRKAIQSYYNTIPPGGTRTLPQTIDALVNDQRFPTPIQHLRRAYPDPMTAKFDWVLIREGGGIVGIHSSSLEAPFMKVNPLGRRIIPVAARTYADWHFRLTLP